MLKYVTPRRFLILAAVVVAGLVLLITSITEKDTSNTRPTTAAPGPAGSDATDASAPTEPVEPTLTDEDVHDGTTDELPLAEPTNDPAAAEAATAFTAAWLNTTGKSPAVWFQGLEHRITGDLREALAGADPKSVPAGCKTGKVTLKRQGPLVTAAAPIVTAEAKPKPVGTLTLTLVEQRGTWLVDEIDWKAER